MNIRGWTTGERMYQVGREKSWEAETLKSRGGILWSRIQGSNTDAGCRTREKVKLVTMQCHGAAAECNYQDV